MIVRWSPLAVERVAEIGDWISADHPLTAIRVIQGIFSAVERLASFPTSGRQVPEFQRTDVREIIYEQFRIVYRLRETQIEILTVRHSLQLMSEEDLTG